MVFEEINVISKAKDTLPIPRKEPLHALYELHWHINENYGYNVGLGTMANILKKDLRSTRRLYSGLADKGYVSMRRFGNETQLDLLVEITATEIYDDTDEEKFIGFTDFKIEFVTSDAGGSDEPRLVETLTDIGVRNFGKSLNKTTLYKTKTSNQPKTTLTYSHYSTLKKQLIKHIANDISGCMADCHPLTESVWERAARAIADDTLKLMKTQRILTSVQMANKLLAHLGIQKEGYVLIDTTSLRAKYPKALP